MEKLKLPFIYRCPLRQVWLYIRFFFYKSTNYIVIKEEIFILFQPISHFYNISPSPFFALFQSIAHFCIISAYPPFVLFQPIPLFVLAYQTLLHAMMAILDLSFCINLSDTIECYDGYIGSSLFVLTYQTLLNAMMAILDLPFYINLSDTIECYDGHIGSPFLY